jgi:hypothetical protein
MATNQKRKSDGDRVQVRFIPCPPGKRAAWRRSMEIITGILLEVLESPASDGECSPAGILSRSQVEQKE